MDALSSDVLHEILRFLSEHDRQIQAARVCRRWRGAALAGCTVYCPLLARRYASPPAPLLARAGRVHIYEDADEATLEFADDREARCGLWAGTAYLKCLPESVRRVSMSCAHRVLALSVALAFVPAHVLDLEICNMTNQMPDYTACLGMTHLTRLVIEGFYAPRRAQPTLDLAASGNTRLCELRIPSEAPFAPGALSGTEVPDETVARCLGAQCVTHLTLRNLPYWNFDLPRLVSLDVAWCRARRPGALPPLTSLERLTVDRCGGSEWLMSLRDMPRLTRLCVPAEALDPAGIERLLARTQLRRLRIHRPDPASAWPETSAHLFWRSVGDHLTRLEVLGVPKIPRCAEGFLHKDLPPRLRLLVLSNRCSTLPLTRAQLDVLAVARPGLWMRVGKLPAAPCDQLHLLDTRKRKAAVELTE